MRSTSVVASNSQRLALFVTSCVALGAASYLLSSWHDAPASADPLVNARGFTHQAVIRRRRSGTGVSPTGSISLQARPHRSGLASSAVALPSLGEIADAYYAFIPRSPIARAGRVSRNLSATLGIVEERSSAYVLQSRVRGATRVLEFSPGGGCKLSHPQHWTVCENSHPKLQFAPGGLLASLPRLTAWSETVGSFANRALTAAWGPKPPRIDAVVRSGALASFELLALLESMVLFWPRTLGDVIVVLDEADRHLRDAIVPPRFAADLRIRILYEPTPCLPGRIWNQVWSAPGSSSRSPVSLLSRIRPR